MTTITIDRELLEQALVALSAPNHCVFSEPPICVDIRAALAAPATTQAAEIERLKAESEERLQNCVALVAEVERLRAAPATAPERKPMHEGEIQAAWLGQDLDEPIPYTFVLGIRSAERFNGIKEQP